MDQQHPVPAPSRIPIKETIKRVTITVVILIFLPVLFSFMIVPSIGWYRHHMPAATNLMKYRMAQAKKAGMPFTATYTFVPLSEISPELIRAVLYAEDSRFYQHHGIDWRSIWTSSLENMKRQRIVWGGSTITMQLCKNMFLKPQKTFLRKYTEMILALRMESALPKWRILELYLNVIEWGPGIFGAENAAQYYFQKSARDLDDVESSLLAAIIMNPRLYKKEGPNPFFESRQQWVYQFMVTGQATPPSADIMLAPYWEFDAPLVSPNMNRVMLVTNNGSISVSGNRVRSSATTSINSTQGIVSTRDITAR